MSSAPSFVHFSSLPRGSSFVNTTSHKQVSRSARNNRPVRTRTEIRSILGLNLPIFTKVERISLPQDDLKNRTERREAIDEAREAYQWTKLGGISDASLVEGLPESERPHLGWIEDVAKVFLRVAANNAAVDADEFGDDVWARTKESVLNVASVFSSLRRKLASGAADRETVESVGDSLFEVVESRSERKGSSFREYKDDFIVFNPDKVASSDQFLSDDIFGWYRVAGPNPMRITKLSGKATAMFPKLTNEIFNGIPGFHGDTLEEAEREDRLFFIDYKEFDGVQHGTLPDGTPKKGYYLYSPKCLLAVPKNVSKRTSVLPIAIQCGQDSSFPMYTPNEKHTNPVTWIAAKLTVQVADAVSHETIYHLGRTHLLLEVFVCATHRALAPNHPLLKLLVNHFYGTAFINSAAVDRLINPGGVIDHITAPPIDVAKDLAAKAVNSPAFSFNDWMPDRELSSRGVLDAQRLKFPYRDDAMRLWEVINEWVEEYLTSYYSSDADVINDQELADWCREIVDREGGSLHGFGETANGQIKTLKYLIRAVSMIIFTASVQHAAVNFPQSTMMQFVPAMPMCGFAPPPKAQKPFNDLDHLVKEMLPNMAQTRMQMNTAELIGVVRYTALGDYGSSLKFGSAKVQKALEKFQQKLRTIGEDIEKRNNVEKLVGLPMYNYLVPSNIPQSINI